MQTLTFKESAVSIYIFPDEETVIVGDSHTVVGDPPKFVISDCNSNNAALYAGVTPPDDWIGHKYLFDGTTWVPNLAYVPPNPIGV